MAGYLPDTTPAPQKNRHLGFIGCVLAGSLLAAMSANAAFIFTATMTNSQENPPTVPTVCLLTQTGCTATNPGQPRLASFGNAIFRLNTEMTAMTFSAQVFNIDFTGLQTPNDVNDNMIQGTPTQAAAGAAHIHASPTVTPATNGPVVWGFINNPFNDNNPNDVVITPFATGVGGFVSGKWDLNEGNGTLPPPSPPGVPVNLTNQIPNLLANRAYINFHTVQFGGGEARGNIIFQGIPEPATLALLGLGLAGLGLSRRKR